jgi:RNA polymerase sigma-70 factor (ECF subfamily)
MALPAPRRDLQQLQQLPDADLVSQIRAGEPALFELVMRRYNRRLFRIVRGILGNDAEAEDVVQEAYVCAWLKLSQFRGPAGFASWLCQIATNEALMYRRRRRNVSLTGLQDADEIADGAGTGSAPPAPGADLHETQLRQMLERAIDELPDMYRDTFVLREMDQMSVAETAQCLGIEEGAVKTRVHRARKLLQRGLRSELSTVLSGAFEFDGARCDRVVAAVLARIDPLKAG